MIIPITIERKVPLVYVAYVHELNYATLVNNAGHPGRIAAPDVCEGPQDPFLLFYMT
jgi:hypothetical protein